MARFRVDGTTADLSPSPPTSPHSRPHSTSMTQSKSLPELDSNADYDDFQPFTYTRPPSSPFTSLPVLALAFLLALFLHTYLSLHNPLYRDFLGRRATLNNDVFTTCPAECRDRTPRELQSTLADAFLNHGPSSIMPSLFPFHSPATPFQIHETLTTHLSSRTRSRKPLLLAFTGPTGTGKSVAASIVARTLLTDTCDCTSSPESTPPVPQHHHLGIPGALLLSSLQQYSHPSALRRRIVSHYLTCMGNEGVIILDGLERADRMFALFLIDLLQEVEITGKLTYYANSLDENGITGDNIDAVGGEVVQVAIKRMVVILLTDVGADVIIKDRIAQHDNQPPQDISSLLLGAIEQQFEAELTTSYDVYGSSSKSHPLAPLLSGGKIVPFPPLTSQQVKKGVEAKLGDVETQGREGGVWDDLDIEEGISETILKQIKGFFVGGAKKDLMLSKYGGHELERNQVLLGLQGAVEGEAERKGGAERGGRGRLREVDGEILLEVEGRELFKSRRSSP